ncbi:MAG TPA: OB-fold nucleic acid binding domain-containing protein, partial [Methanothrix sp.]|nr:OB-fold nucleic acid binding domain-containing protein [Methanothrix sp.]
MNLCERCRGKGYLVVGEKPCPNCNGSGKTGSLSLGEASDKDMMELIEAGSAKCSVCHGSGKIPVTESCPDCGGLGREYLCVVCKTRLTSKKELCERCAKKPLVHILDPACDVRDLVVGDIYQGRVNGLANFGAFVDLSESVRGLAHNKYLKSRPEVGDVILVTVRNILPNGNIELEPADVKEYNTVEVEKELPVSKAAELSKMVGKQIMIKGEIIQVKQTGGPTIFTVADDSGLVFCAAFERAGVRAYAEIDSEMMVKVIGEVSLRNNQVQVEIKSMKRLWGRDASAVKDLIEQVIDQRAEPFATEFLVKSDVMTRLLPAMRQVAKEIRRAVLKSQPIVVRHHADADGITAAVAIESA